MSNCECLDPAKWGHEENCQQAEIDRLNAQALDLVCEISKLRRELDEARALLAQFVEDCACVCAVELRERARAALQPDQPTVLEEYFCPNCANAGCTDCTPELR